MTEQQHLEPSDEGAIRREPVRPPIDPFLAEPEPTPAEERGEPAAATDELVASRPRGRRMVAFGTAAVLLVGVGAGAGAFAANALERPPSMPSGAFSQGSATTPFGGSSTDGSGSGGSTSGGPQGGGAPSFGGRFGPDEGGTSGAIDGVAATAAQSKGVVTVTTRLGYRSASAAGTGIVLTSSGEILTNNHVIEGSTSITVTDETTDRSYSATVVGTDATHDVAVLRLKHASGLTTASIATDPATVGEAVTAVGNAGGTGTLSAASGAVTALKQSITTAAEGSDGSEQLSDLIETDADIVAGDSGGPLLDEDGKVIGIDTAASSGVRDVTGYAVPIRTALAIARTIDAGTDTADITIGTPAFLGIEIAGDSGTTSGAVVGSVLSGTPAESAGLAEGDTITAVDGHAVASATDLTTRLHAEQPGAGVPIAWTTPAGEQHQATVTLIAGPAD